ncbi:hypothetical protein P389DRAFT_15814 [Cystobasidium minutum MCA 4210]|uniref:uncharacterized protein n=1 Tax=Cystobasidium minutum MCA 4210 TaxID=1397322 RepID=UPI0034CE29E0|eukprot:jgi/Rhomi1/15814/CE15813_1720
MDYRTDGQCRPSYRNCARIVRGTLSRDDRSNAQHSTSFHILSRETRLNVLYIVYPFIHHKHLVIRLHCFSLALCYYFAMHTLASSLHGKTQATI